MSNTNAQLAALGFSIAVTNTRAIFDPEWGSGSLVIRHDVTLKQGEETVMTSPYTQGHGNYPELAELLENEDIIELDNNLKWQIGRAQDIRRDRALMVELIHTLELRKVMPTQLSRGGSAGRSARRRNTELYKADVKLFTDKYARLKYPPLKPGISDLKEACGVADRRIACFEIAVQKSRDKIEQAGLSAMSSHLTIDRMVEEGKLTRVNLSDVLFSLLMDATEETFEDWASEFGFDTDSRKAEKMWKDCVATHKSLTSTVLSTTLEDAREILQDF
jgi:hypothetical protein